MSCVAVVYWSGTGNTEAMANAVLEGAKSAGADAKLFTSADFSASLAGEYDAIAFGCPAMGAEELEEDEFAPMYESCKESLSGRRVALFGSYGWGDGEWMRNWEESVKKTGADLISEGVTACESPDDEALAACRELGKALAS